MFEKDLQDWKSNIASAWKILENITRTNHKDLIMKHRGSDTKMAEPHKAWTAIKSFYVKDSPNLQFNDIKADLMVINVTSSGDIEVDIGRVEVAVLELAYAAVQIGKQIDNSEQIYAYISAMDKCNRSVTAFMREISTESTFTEYIANLKKKVSLKTGVDKILSTASTTRVSHETNESTAKTLVVAGPEDMQAALLANPSRANFNKYRKSMKQSRDKPQSSLHAASQVSAQSEGRDSRSNCKPTNTHDRNRSNREDRRDKPYRERDRERGTGTTTGGCMMHGPKANHSMEQFYAMKKMIDESRSNTPQHRVQFDGRSSLYRVRRTDHHHHRMSRLLVEHRNMHTCLILHLLLCVICLQVT
jgi:hypothetical protein